VVFVVLDKLFKSINSRHCKPSFLPLAGIQNVVVFTLYSIQQIVVSVNKTRCKYIRL
jgi:hypothetical protein